MVSRRSKTTGSKWGIKIISGGQTGADRAALDFARDRKIPHGGWCPKGRRAEDGEIDSRYKLTETPSSRYSQRTEWNVRDSEGTVVFSTGRMLSGGSKVTVEQARRLGKPVLHLWRRGKNSKSQTPNPKKTPKPKSQRRPEKPEEELLSFIRKHRIRTLNVAGPRASEQPEVGEFVKEVLEKMWRARTATRKARENNVFKENCHRMGGFIACRN